MTARETDEMHLEWPRLADAGVPRRKIGQMFGKSESTVINLIIRVRKEYAQSEAA